MNALISLIAKEFLLLRRDMHGLLLLFVMPCLFILIMSFALSEQYQDEQVIAHYYLLDQDNTEASQAFAKALKKQAAFELVPAEQHSVKQMSANIGQDKAQFLLMVYPDHQEKMKQGNIAVKLLVSPETHASTAQLFTALLREHMGKVTLKESLAEAFTEESAAIDEINNNIVNQMDKSLLVESSFGDPQQANQKPSAVQQNVPAWLLFAMFFIAIPLSTTVIRERDQGTLDRLRSMHISSWQLMTGKLVPYFALNLLQVAAMLLVGRFLIPVLGGEQLQILGSPAALLLISAACSALAVSYALLIATIATTTEQATIAAGVCNIIMAALGGIMVPRFIMPSAMQELSNLSPMAWGLDGFLDILLRAGTVKDVAKEASLLLALATLLLTAAMLLNKYRRTKH